MADKTHTFDAALYRRAWRWLMRAIFGITGIIDIVLLWELFFDVPAEEAMGQMAALWTAPLLILLLFSIGFAGYCLRRYDATMELRKKSYVTIREHEVIHHVQELGILREPEGKTKPAAYGSDTVKSEYACYLSFRITEVTDVRRDQNGGIILQGAVERTYYNEYSWDELGSYVRSVIINQRHKIPAYYEDMEGVFAALENMRVSGRTGVQVTAVTSNIQS